MACGTGKTLVGRWHAENLRATITVVVVPSLTLLAQTLQEWRSAGPWPFEALICCSDPTTANGERERAANDGQDVALPIWARLQARVTTNVAVVETRLAEPRGQERPLVIFSTYHSINVVAQAVRAAKKVVDVVIADEAHNLAGRPRPEFRPVLDDRLPARARVFMTATPVVSAAIDSDPVFDDWSAPLSMDNEDLFGPTAYRLDFSDAIARKLLADYKVVVYETSGDSTTPDPAAALAAAADAGLTRVLSFHGRVSKARAFAAAVDSAVLPDGRRVRAHAVAGTDPVVQRQQALSLLESAPADTLTVVSSARCLSAGIDVPAVDGVLFADPKNSDVDVIQAVGRALRTAPNKTHGMILIPVCIPAGFDEDTVLSTGSFAAVWRILRGLRAMDPRLAEELRQLERGPSRRGTSTGESILSRIDFRIPSLHDLDGLQARLVDFLSPQWDNTFSELELFIAQFGHARPALRTRLGQWCERQRSAYRNKMLTGDRAQKLRNLPGWTWNLREQRWLDQWAQVYAVANASGELDIEDPSVSATALHVPEPKSRVNTVGRWAAWQRQQIRRGDLDSWKITKLLEIPGFGSEALAPDDAAAVMILAEYVAWKGDANPPAHVVEDDVPVGLWLNMIRRRRVTRHLSQSLLDEICICTPSEGPGKLRWYRDETFWLLGLEALRQFVAREGHCRIPENHSEQLLDTPVALHQWSTRQRYTYRHDQLLSARAQLLERVAGWRWECEPAPRVKIDIGDTPHGERTGYVKGCRCTPCTGANNQKNAEREARIAAGLPSTVMVDADRARRHLQHLVAQGATQKALVRASGLSRSNVQNLLLGKRNRVTPETEQTVLALTISQAPAAIGAGSLVDAGTTWRLLDDMIASGWPKSWIARELGLGKSLQLNRDSITASNAAKVSDLHARLGSRAAPPRRGRQSMPSLSELLNTTCWPNADDRQAEVINWSDARRNSGKALSANNADDGRVDDNHERSA
ncbi:restriction endonuclease subunit R [Mycobacterium sp. CBMA 213]|nr:restriction endonuclease subunit R [Mycolicibacterium sp. CBMA 335]MUM03240.1 restriction endonuclease subunit R [Mycolicibacterium sp. CBMA 213]